MPRFKLTWWNNPLSWLLALLLIILIGNLVARGEVVVGFPEHTFVDPDNIVDADLSDRDSITIIATQAYKAKGFKRWYHGTGYRSAWGTPVKVPILWLDSIFGGIVPIKKGGGNQTLSMELADTTKQQYTLRSVCKNPESLVPNWSYYLGLDNIISDGISAGHPYGGLVLPTLSDAAGIPHTNPRVYFVPKQSALDTFNEDFANKLFLLEYEPDGKHTKWTGFEDVKNMYNSKDLLEYLEDDNEDIKINYRLLVKARLFDIWIGDWDRHGGQWAWAKQVIDGQRVFHPVPTDRDNVFYGISGFLPILISKFETRLQPFRETIGNLNGLTKNAKYFDSIFLFDQPESMYLEEAKKLQQSLTDEVIEQAFQHWPADIYKLDGEHIVHCLKQRRADLLNYAKEYHQVIQERGRLEKPAKRKW